MKIGIITWFRYENYGTKLQAIALQAYLRGKGHAVQLIDFAVPEPSGGLARTSLFSRARNKWKFLQLQRARKKFASQLEVKSRRMEQIIAEHCVLTDYVNDDAAYIHVCNQFDLIICGSDQIWNPNWFHRYYYADFPEIRTRKVSYAPSLGIRKIPEEVKPLMRHSLAGFSHITVREENAAVLLEPLIGYRPQKVLDPTMLFSGQQWEKMFQLDTCRDSYLLCYFLSDNQRHWAAARAFAREHNLKMKIIPQEGDSYFQKGTICADAGVKEFLQLILNASYVITDSFHGTVFSLLFGKEVFVFERFPTNDYSSQNDRVRDLADQFEIRDHLISFGTNRIVPTGRIEYSNVTVVLDSLRKQSEEILQTEITE